MANNNVGPQRAPLPYPAPSPVTGAEDEASPDGAGDKHLRTARVQRQGPETVPPTSLRREETRDLTRPLFLTQFLWTQDPIRNGVKSEEVGVCTRSTTDTSIKISRSRVSNCVSS